MKFGRRYRITIQTSDTVIPIGNQVGAQLPGTGQANAIVIEPPLTIEFNIHRTAMASLNGMTLRIYNLSPTNRAAIFQDRFNTKRFKIVVEAGYDTLATVFVGDIFEANSTRQGSDIVTTIDARDGNFAVSQGVVNATLAKGTTLKQTLEFLTQQLAAVTTGLPNTPSLQIGKLSGIKEYDFSRGVVLEGNVYEQIKKYADLNATNVFIDLEVINIIGQDEVIIADNITLIDASTGLLETPRRDNAYLTVTTLFEPRVVMGQIIQLTSAVIPEYNGLYKVIGATHKGIISEAINGKCISIFNLLGPGITNGFKTI